MAVQDKHPQYVEVQKNWQLMQDASSVAGQKSIKDKTTVYLPKSSGQVEAESIGENGKVLYSGYISRAQYPLWVQDSMRTMIGLVSKLNPEINIKSSQLQHLITNATNDGFGLKQLFTRIVEQILRFGRCGIYVDVDANGRPYFALYDALSIINWKENSIDGRKDLNLIVLEEQHNDGDDIFSHQTKTVYRVVQIDSGQLVVELHDGDTIEDKTPSIGNKNLEYAPFIFGGAIDNSPSIGTIPLLTMAESAIKYYQLSADYFQSLHHTAHPQPWVSGLNNDDDDLSVTGVMAAWLLPQGATCGYMEVNGVGIDKTKSEMDAQKSAALEAGAKVVDTTGQESGEARKARQSDQHASLHSIVINAASMIQQAIRYAAQWLQLNTEECTFTVKPEFSTDSYDIALAKQLYEGAISGKNSFQTYWEYIATGKLTERTYQEELDLVAEESMHSPNLSVQNE